VADTIEVALLSGHRDLGYGVEEFDDSPDIYYESSEELFSTTQTGRPSFIFHLDRQLAR